jgi:hypothetical protein
MGIDGMTPGRKAAHTAKWANTMTRWLVTRLRSRPAWKMVAFTGPRGGESVGIVDVLAIRKDHRGLASGFKRGDAFEIILFQIKGGSAPWPTTDEILRLQQVGQFYRARAVVLAVWKKGRQPVLYALKATWRDDGNFRSAWDEITAVAEFFK